MINETLRAGLTVASLSISPESNRQSTQVFAPDYTYETSHILTISQLPSEQYSQQLLYSNPHNPEHPSPQIAPQETDPGIPDEAVALLQVGVMVAGAAYFLGSEASRRQRVETARQQDRDLSVVASVLNAAATAMIVTAVEIILSRM